MDLLICVNSLSSSLTGFSPSSFALCCLYISSTTKARVAPVKVFCKAWRTMLSSRSYMAWESVFFDFDVIDLTFNKEGVYTVIPVVSDPIDVVNGLTSPTDMEDDGVNILALIALILILIVVLVVLMPVLPYIAKGVVWLVCLPFKAIAKLCKSISNGAKKRKERKHEKQNAKKTE